MADRPPPPAPQPGEEPPAHPPGVDEIVVSAPEDQPLCSSLSCRNMRRPAEVIVTYGQLGGNWWDKDSLWPNCWGRSYPLCGECWERSRKVAERYRPNLVITDTRLD